MASHKRTPTTAAHRFLKRHRIFYENHTYPYVDRGGTHQVALALGIDEHQVIKTLVMETDDRKNPFLVLMHGDKQVSAKRLSRWMGVKRVIPCDIENAQRLTGYQVGGISPFGTRTRLKAYAPSTILELDWIYINGGKRGLMISIQPHALVQCLDCQILEAIAVNN
jgi:Cys-tRNA(Pro) deacylase